MTPEEEEEKVRRLEIAGLKNSIIINCAHLLETQRQFFIAPKKTLLSKTLLSQSKKEEAHLRRQLRELEEKENINLESLWRP